MNDLWVLQLQTLIYAALGWSLAVALAVFVLVCLVRLIRVGRQTRALYRLEDYLQ